MQEDTTGARDRKHGWRDKTEEGESINSKHKVGLTYFWTMPSAVMVFHSRISD